MERAAAGYPAPIVDLAQSRLRALEAFGNLPAINPAHAPLPDDPRLHHAPAHHRTTDACATISRFTTRNTRFTTIST
ncbi:hypothetical protein G6F65_023191 [Rhizopus arrhizus]|nr:hypothetical protein G6F65_023191 [Rhizopus arrhizus]